MQEGPSIFINNLVRNFLAISTVAETLSTVLSEGDKILRFCNLGIELRMKQTLYEIKSNKIVRVYS